MLHLPLNGHIRGLFFYTNRINDQYKCFSTLGNTCLDIYAERLLDPNLINVYFADMYCFSHWSQLFFKKLFNVPLNNKKPEHQFEKPHYITLVVCKKDSRSDLFCEDHIKKLELHNNLFLKTRPNKEDPNLVEFFTNPRVNVEILYTEELKIYQTELQTVEVRGKGNGSKTRQSCINVLYKVQY
ncbi:PHYHIP-C domain-containing protein [Aphelenchoides bicaudatus]|nr:PHYHIP-C domain-containing protein [Aphelenchoides bicaudatus]